MSNRQRRTVEGLDVGQAFAPAEVLLVDLAEVCYKERMLCIGVGMRVCVDDPVAKVDVGVPVEQRWQIRKDVLGPVRVGRGRVIVVVV